MKWIHVLMLLTSLIAVFADSERFNVRVEVPEAVIVGSKVKLFCLFEKEDYEDFEVVWYKNNEWFYRYKTRNGLRSVSRQYQCTCDINMNRSTYKKIVMKRIGIEQRGLYRCEVNRATKGHVQAAESYMQVVEPPMSDPTIHLEQLTYAEGDTLRGYCTPPESELTPNITWLINGNEVQTDKPRKSYDPEQKRTFLASNVSWVVEPTEGGDLRVECVADLFNISSRTSSVTVHVTEPSGVETTTPPTTP